MKPKPNSSIIALLIPPPSHPPPLPAFSYFWRHRDVGEDRQDEEASVRVAYCRSEGGEQKMMTWL